VTSRLFSELVRRTRRTRRRTNFYAYLDLDELQTNQCLCVAAAAFKHKKCLRRTKLHPTHFCPDRDFACLWWLSPCRVS